MDRENCKYYVVEDVTAWHSDVFDPPNYKYFCNYNNEMKELIFPIGQCVRCKKMTNRLDE